MKKNLPALFHFLSIVAPKLAATLALNLFATSTRVPRPESEMENFKASKKYFLKDGTAAFEWGNPNDPIVFLIHGWNGRGTQIAFCQEELVKNHFRVIALDGPAHGDSPGKKTNPVAFADFILKSQKELAPEGIHAIVAHSFGGGATALACDRGLKTKKVVLVASPSRYDVIVDDFMRMIKLSDKAKRIFIEKIIKLTGIQPAYINVGDLLKKLNIKVMIAHDTTDTAVNFQSAVEMHAKIPGSKLLKTEDLGHRRILKSPLFISQVTDFIKN